mmetsp:Transcript_17446/g.45358  ORF Transcript_17446/g.45358 Transcript_17446/m.45358 type:complete len:158 (-) Transcript_17446:160-633(-)
MSSFATLGRTAQPRAFVVGGARRATVRAARGLSTRRDARSVTCMAVSMEFIKGIKEPCVPDVKLTRSRDGGQGTASFIFSQPSVFEAGNELGEITGLYMNDDEGTIATTDVNAKFVNGKPSAIECKYVMKSTYDWDRFMRFMERYAEENGLGFSGKN